VDRIFLDRDHITTN